MKFYAFHYYNLKLGQNIYMHVLYIIKIAFSKWFFFLIKSVSKNEFT